MISFSAPLKTNVVYPSAMRWHRCKGDALPHPPSPPVAVRITVPGVMRADELALVVGAQVSHPKGKSEGELA